MTQLTRVTLKLAHNPDEPNVDLNHGYIIDAPIGRDGKLSEDIWDKNKEACLIKKFGHSEDDFADGQIIKRGGNWFFDYGLTKRGLDENGFKLGEHRFWLGDYVTINDYNGKALTYLVTGNT